MILHLYDLLRFAGCANPTAPEQSDTCVPDLAVTMSLSLDGGVTFSNSVSLKFGFVRPLKIAFLYPGPVTDFGWTYSHNKGRLSVETKFGGLVNAATYIEGVDEGEFEGGQPNHGKTVATGTPVNELLAGGAKNLYYAALTKLKKFCDDDFDLVMSTSFGFMTQTLDVSSGYAACRTASDGITPHPTRFLHAGGFKTNNLMSTAFGAPCGQCVSCPPQLVSSRLPMCAAKIYQMRYLTGLVAGDALRAAKSLPYATPRNGTCVGYVAGEHVASAVWVVPQCAIMLLRGNALVVALESLTHGCDRCADLLCLFPQAAYPLPEVQRGINAFALGCRARFPACTVKVMWTGTWHSVKVEGAGAHYFWNTEVSIASK